MSVEYWNREKGEWRESLATPEDEIKAINDTVGWEMYRKVE